MSRSCHQEGHVRLRDDVKRPYWQGLYRVRSEDQPGGKWKSENLGYKDEITKRQAQRRFQKIISKMESEIIRLPRSVMTVKTSTTWLCRPCSGEVQRSACTSPGISCAIGVRRCFIAPECRSR